MDEDLCTSSNDCPKPEAGLPLLILGLRTDGGPGRLSAPATSISSFRKSQGRSYLNELNGGVVRTTRVRSEWEG